jgi:hypothetical protein
MRRSIADGWSPIQTRFFVEVVAHRGATLRLVRTPSLEKGIAFFEAETASRRWTHVALRSEDGRTHLCADASAAYREHREPPAPRA